MRRDAASSGVPRTTSAATRYLVRGTHWGTLADDAAPAMTRHDFEAWLEHHLDQSVLVEWRTLSDGLVTDKTSTTGVLRKDGGDEYHAGDAHIDLTDFEAADFGGEGVVVELLRESAELYIAVS